MLEFLSTLCGHLIVAVPLVLVALKAIETGNTLEISLKFTENVGGKIVVRKAIGQPAPSAAPREYLPGRLLSASRDAQDIEPGGPSG
jgi:hypothetical protein